MTVLGSKLTREHREKISLGLKKYHSVPGHTEAWYEKFVQTRTANLETGGGFTRRKYGESEHNVVPLVAPADDWECAEVIEVRYRCPRGEVNFEVNRSGELYISVSEGIDAGAALEMTHRASAFVARHDLLRRVGKAPS